MSQRVAVPQGAWTNIGTGPAFVQLISPSATGNEAMVECVTAQPSTNQEGIVLNGLNSIIKLSLAQTLWAQGIQGPVILNVQPDVAG
jgi:hypothetical protein